MADFIKKSDLKCYFPLHTNLEADSISKQISEPQYFWQRNNFNKIRVRT